jgi:hypothetical protein
MKTIVISDLHNRVDWVEPFLSSLTYDRVVFLGDYFDDFFDTNKHIVAAAKWLSQSLEHEDRIHLMGTHDMWYRFPTNIFLSASGNTEGKCKRINKILTPEDWNKLVLYHSEQGFLLTHAGLHPSISTLKAIPSAAEKAMTDAKNGKTNKLTEAGFARGGFSQSYGGITWLDWNVEFEPIPNVNQIVGHTELEKQNWIPQQKITENSINYCIDTRNRHYGVLENNVFEIFEIKK